MSTWVENSGHKAWLTKLGIGWQEDTGDVLKEDLQTEVLATPYPPASKPGEAPHYRTEDLKDSVIVYTKGKWTYVGPTVPYAMVLEAGGPTNWGYIEARPYLRPLVAYRVKNKIMLGKTRR